MNQIQRFINEVGGIKACIGRERKDLYSEFETYCLNNGIAPLKSQSFVRRLNLMYGTELKLVTRDCRVTYIIVEKQSVEENSDGSNE